ncbi:unnamed protein product [Cylindrotheca closterium]|uniref:Uncharacterized protein n=1 Tax=Cylindrotheca closterium TaxID=2856 RepID=A0AAD2CXF4_9STRA|nr:unnamed protein product [Cylindrotheca closterium]
MPSLQSMIFLWTLSQSQLYSNAFELRTGIKESPFAQTSLPTNEGSCTDSRNRRKFLECAGLTLFGAAFAPTSCRAMTSYSANARNFDRMNSGDFSGGSLYDNNPKSEAGKKRRAMVGCKTEASRREGSQQLNQPPLSEQQCNKLVMGGETEFMLQALRKLDCPTCPYGIGAAPN